MKKKAILLSGGVNYQCNYPRYANDLGFAYKVFTECCNYNIEDITVLYSYGNDIVYNGKIIKTKIASEHNLKYAMNEAITQLNEEDELTILVSNHGDNVGNGVINLWNQKAILLDEFANLLKQIRAKKIIVLGECYAGNFIRNDISNVCILAGNEKDRCTYVHPYNENYDEFLYNFLSYIYGSYPDTEEKICNTEVDVEKAFCFALHNDAFNPDNPCYYSGYNKDGRICIEIPQMFCNIANTKELLK